MRHPYHILFISLIGIVLLHGVLAFGFFGGSSGKKEEAAAAESPPIVATEDVKAKASAGRGGKAAKNPLLSDAPVELFMKTAAHFPDHPFPQFVSGETANVLLGLQNLWSNHVTVFGVSGAYYSPDHASLVRNITMQKTWMKVATGEQAAFGFQLKPEMEPCTLGLVLYIDYTDGLTEKTWHRAVAYNQTVEIMSPSDSLFDMKSLFIYALGLVLLLGSFGLMRDTVFGGSKSSGSKKEAKGKLGLAATFSSSSIGGGSSPSNASTGSIGSSSAGGRRSVSPDGTWTPLSADDSANSEWIPDMHFTRKSPKMKSKKP